MASRHAWSLGRIPPETPASAASTASALASLMTLSGSPGSRSQPTTSVRKMTLCAPTARATAAAAWPALALCRPPGRRDGGPRLVGVDVVRQAHAVGPHAGDDRDVVLGDALEQIGVDALDAADEADVLPARRGHPRDAEQCAVVAAEADGRLPVAVEAQDDVLVDLADEDHLGHLDGLGVGHAQPADELDRQVEPLHVRRDVGTAAVDDDRVDADVLEQHDVTRELLAQLRVGHRRAAVLDDDRAPVELADVREGLEEGFDVAHQIVLSRIAGLPTPRPGE